MNTQVCVHYTDIHVQHQLLMYMTLSMYMLHVCLPDLSHEAEMSRPSIAMMRVISAVCPVKRPTGSTVTEATVGNIIETPQSQHSDIVMNMQVHVDVEKLVSN